MKIAVATEGDVGRRAALILLNGTGLTSLGLVDADPRRDADPRVVRADDLGEFDAVLTDHAEPNPLVQRSVEAGVPITTWVEWRGEANSGTILTGANLATGIAASIAHHEAARSAEVISETIAWTEQGKPLRKGTPVAFPDPVGARWGREVTSSATRTEIAVPIEGQWAGAAAHVTAVSGEGVVTRIVGVADLAAHLEAIALAAGAATVAHYEPGLRVPTDNAERYLSKALEMGLAVATHSEGTVTD